MDRRKRHYLLDEVNDRDSVADGAYDTVAVGRENKVALGVNGATQV